jgi:hypothetical protein
LLSGEKKRQQELVEGVVQRITQPWPGLTVFLKEFAAVDRDPTVGGVVIEVGRHAHQPKIGAIAWSGPEAQEEVVPVAIGRPGFLGVEEEGESFQAWGTTQLKIDRNHGFAGPWQGSASQKVAVHRVFFHQIPTRRWRDEKTHPTDGELERSLRIKEH